MSRKNAVFPSLPLVRPATWWTLILGCLILVPMVSASSGDGSLDLPWRQAGLDEHQAAVHLLDRLTYGPRPGDVERVVAMGLDVWVEGQLAGNFSEQRVDGLVKDFHSLSLSARKTSETYLTPALLARLAEREGVLEAKQMEDLRAAFQNAERGQEQGDRESRRGVFESRRQLMEWAQSRGIRSQRELFEETLSHKLLRATYGENQLTEVLVDFWFNHFNVSLTDNESRVYIPSYERDAIRPFVLGSFRDMLEATAKHPAMLHYLDNARSIADEGQPTTMDVRVAAFREQRGGRFGGRRGGRDVDARRSRDRRNGLLPANRRPEGLNENYARELLELHTLGVDGGYDQQDVIEVARAFTGWAALPPGIMAPDLQQRIARAQRFPQAGFVFEGAFVFRADSHDAAKKTLLGHTMPAGRGIEDGLEVLDLLAVHPSTAQHLGRKLAVRFVSDEPSEALVERLAQSYLSSRGDLTATMRTLVQSPEFWQPEVRSQKIKSPLELTVSALRGLDAEITDVRGLHEWLGRMGQPLYAYQAPTGYPDRATAWVNTGALLNRMNFGLQLATGRVPGVQLDLLDLRQGREPESMDAALEAYLPLLLPQRDTTAAMARLQPIIRDPDLLTKIEDASPNSGTPDYFDDSWSLDGPGADRRRDRGRRWGRRPMPDVSVDDSPLAQVVGVILGSPEFQRR